MTDPIVKLGYLQYSQGINLPLRISLRSHPMVLITGKSGSGKGVLLAYMCNSALNTDYDLYIGDPKCSEDFSGLTPYYAEGDAVPDLIEEVYHAYQEIKAMKTGKHILLICDEYPSMILNLQGRDKKRATEISNMVGEMLMQGRSLPGGGSVALWLIAQRADADYFPKGSRLNFMVTIGLGKLDTQSRQMLFPGEDLPDYLPRTGTGLIAVDGRSEINVLKVPIVDLKKLKLLLQKKARRRFPGGAGDQEPGGGTT